MCLKEIYKPWDRIQPSKGLFIISHVPSSGARWVEGPKMSTSEPTMQKPGGTEWELTHVQVYFCVVRKPQSAWRIKARKRLRLCVEVMCLAKSLGFARVKSFHTLECPWQWGVVEDFYSRKPWSHQCFGKMNLAGVFGVVCGWGMGRGLPGRRFLCVLLLVVRLLCQSPLHVVGAAHSYKSVLTQEV